MTLITVYMYVICLLVAIQAQPKYIQPIASSSGLFFDYIGKLKITNGHLDVIVPLDVSHYPVHIENIKSALYTVNSLCAQSDVIKDVECNSTIDPLMTRYHDIITSYDSLSHLVPKRMRRSAWISVGGSILKTVFGNLNEDDAIRYDDAITMLQENDKHLASMVKENILITKSTLSSYNKTVTQLNTNQANLNKAISELSVMVKNITKQSHKYKIISKIDSILNSLETSILTLSFQLEDLNNAIVFGGQNILSPSVMSPVQLYRELSEHYKYLPNNADLPFALNINEIHSLLNVVQLKCYSYNKKIVFIVQIPLVFPSEYNLYHNLPLPLPHNRENPNTFSFVIPSVKYIAVTKNKLQYCNLDSLEHCRIYGNTHLCDVMEVFSSEANPSCESELITKIVNKLPSQCQTQFIYGNIDIWHPLENNKWIYIQSQPNKISIDCTDSELYEETLYGTGIVSLPNMCIAYCKTTQLIPKRNVYNITVTVNNSDFNLINDSCCNVDKVNEMMPNVSPVKLQDITLDNLKDTEINSILKGLDKVIEQPGILKYVPHYTVMSSVVFVLIVGFIVYQVIVCCKIPLRKPTLLRNQNLKSELSITTQTLY